MSGVRIPLPPIFATLVKLVDTSDLKSVSEKEYRFKSDKSQLASVTQLVRVSGCGSESRGFNSPRPPIRLDSITG